VPGEIPLALDDRLHRAHQEGADAGLGVGGARLGSRHLDPSGEAMANMLATFAQFERRLISQRTKEALAVKKASGVRLGRPPTMPQEVVRRIQRQRARGYSLRKIAEDLNEACRQRRVGSSGTRLLSVTSCSVRRSYRSTLDSSGGAPSPANAIDSLGPTAGSINPPERRLAPDSSGRLTYLWRGRGWRR
jgi:resolvase-like protein